MKPPAIRKSSELVTFRTGKLDSNAAEVEGKYPFFTCAQETYQINSFAFDTECVLLAGNNAAAIFPLKYFKGKFNAYQRTYVIETKSKEVLDIKYFYFYLRPFLKAFEQQATGATTKFLTIRILNNIDIVLPSIQNQRKIASILSAYDDLIENNKRRIAILEKMAEEIYREWFVRMRFPASVSDFAKATEDKPSSSKSVESGPTAQLMQIKRLVTFQSGYSFKSHDYAPSGPFGIVTIKNVHDGLYISECTDRIEQPPSNMKKYCHLRDGDILMSLTGNVGRVCRVYGTGNLLNQRVAKLAPTIEGTEDFVYWFFRNNSVQTLCELISTGAAQQNLSPIKLGEQMVPLPPIEQIKKFCVVVRPITELINNLLKQNLNLVSSRDFLLPRLISGKLSVENLELPSNEKLTSVSSALPQQELAHA